MAYVEAVVNYYFAETRLPLFIASFAVSASFFHKPLSYAPEAHHKPLVSQYGP